MLICEMFAVVRKIIIQAESHNTFGKLMKLLKEKPKNICITNEKLYFESMNYCKHKAVFAKSNKEIQHI